MLNSTEPQDTGATSPRASSKFKADFQTLTIWA